MKVDLRLLLQRFESPEIESGSFRDSQWLQCKRFMIREQTQTYQSPLPV